MPLGRMYLRLVVEAKLTQHVSLTPEFSGVGLCANVSMITFCSRHNVCLCRSAAIGWMAGAFDVLAPDAWSRLKKKIAPWKTGRGEANVYH